MARKLKAPRASSRRQSRRSRTLAEDVGLRTSDVRMSRAPGSQATTPLDQQLDAWWALWKMTPIALMCRVHAGMMRQILEKSPRPARKRRRAA
jgi:hypothetical protein